VYKKEEIPRVPIVATGNDFSTLYAPLIRDGRMEKFYWNPTREDRIGICAGIFRDDPINKDDVAVLVDTFPGQSIDFFGSLRSRIYDDVIWEYVQKTGVKSLNANLVNTRNPPKFDMPQIGLQMLLNYTTVEDYEASHQLIDRCGVAASVSSVSSFLLFSFYSAWPHIGGGQRWKRI